MIPPSILDAILNPQVAASSSGASLQDESSALLLDETGGQLLDET